MKHLEMILDSLKTHTKKPELEQYTIPGKLASEILFFAKDDFYNNIALDFGCGSGRLAIGCKLLGAKRVIGIDIDKEAIEVAKKNAEYLNLDIDFYCMDIREVDEEFLNAILKEDKDLKRVVIQNPPFGAQKRHADRIFIDKALELGDVIYTIHNYPTKDFIINYVKGRGRITHIYETNFKIPAIYKFHKKRLVEIPVVIFRIERV